MKILWKYLLMWSVHVGKLEAAYHLIKIKAGTKIPDALQAENPDARKESGD